jgi:predicted PurR-regulated permease PerM
MSYFEELMKGDIAKKVVDILKKSSAILILVVVFYLFRSMMDLLLLTFMFTYGFYSAHDFIYRNVNKYVKISRNIVAMAVYLILILVIVLLGIKYVPLLIQQLIEITNQISAFDISSVKDKIHPRIYELIQGVNIKDYIRTAGTNLIETITNIGKIGLNVFIAFILSLFFVLEKEELKNFGKRLENSNAAYLFRFYKYFAKHFVESFGKVLKTQFLVAFINGVLSTIMLAALGFPQVLGLGFMVFIFGMIPVAGVIITLIPLTIIAYKVGGVMKIVYILVMIAILHALESYVLNPKLMSAKTKLPVFITFAVLLISEHFMGIWGLLIGLPLFMFLMKLIGIDESDIGKAIKRPKLNK